MPQKTSLANQLVEGLDHNRSALFGQYALQICSELSAQIIPLAEEAKVSKVYSGYTSKAIEFDEEQPDGTTRRAWFTIDIFGALRDLSPEEMEKAKCSGCDQDPGDALRQLLIDSCAMLALAHDAGLDALLFEQQHCRSFVDDIMLNQEQGTVGMVLFCMSVLHACAREEDALIEETRVRASLRNALQEHADKEAQRRTAVKRAANDGVIISAQTAV